MQTKEREFAELDQFLETYKPRIEEALRDNLPLAPTHIESEFIAALDYVLFDDNETRICPTLTLLGAELFEGNAEEVLPASVAVEFIHKSSAIFEDLFSKNILRNEKETLHEKFSGELAIMLGISLLNAAYPLVFVKHTEMPEQAFAAHAEMVECVSGAGLIDGQGHDEIEGTSKNLTTPALIRLALRLGAILSEANYLELANLSRFAELLGDSYNLDENSTELESSISDAKRFLIEHFQSNDARSSMIQLSENLSNNVGLK